MLGAIALFGLLTFGAFAESTSTEKQFVYIAVSFALILPVLMLLGGLADTLRQGAKNIGLPPTAFLCALLGGLVIFAGVAMAFIRAIVGFKLDGATQTTAADAAYNASLLGGVAVALGGIAWWSVKITGRVFSEVGRILALLLAGGAIIAAVPELISGFLDQPGGFQASIDNVRGGVEACNLISAIGLCLVALGLLGFGGLVLKSLLDRSTAPADPFGGHTLEWATASPPPSGNFTEAVAVVRSERPLLDAKEAQ
jgi:cytochrome c oxidase subunit I+III